MPEYCDGTSDGNVTFADDGDVNAIVSGTHEEAVLPPHRGQRLPDSAPLAFVIYVRSS